MRSLALWLGLTAVYALAVLAGGADAAPPVPWALERLQEAIGTVPLQLVGAALTALAFTALAGTARRTIGGPWATSAALLVALSPPALACATRVGADPWAAATLAGAVALTARSRTDMRRRDALCAGLLLALVPWFGVWHAVAGLVVLVALVRWTRRRGRPVVALVCAEMSLATGLSLYEVGLPGGPPAAAGTGPLPLLTVLADRGDGLVRWAPVLLLVLVGAFWLWRSVRDGLARLAPERAEAEAAGTLTGAVGVATIAAAAFGGVSPLAVLPVAVPLVAWGARRAPRAAAVLGAATLAGSAWGAVAVAADDAGGWTGLGLTAPWGPLTAAFPDVAAGGWWPTTLAACLLAALLALAVAEWRAREATLTAAATGRR